LTAHINPATPRSPAGHHNPWFIAFVISIAPFMEVLDTTIANVALTHIAGSLAASQDESTWILTAYLVSNAIILPISGWLTNVLGRKRIFLICIAGFSVTSALCGIAPSLGFMLVARVLQGLAGGGLAPVGQSMLTDSFPPEKRSQVFALYGLTVIAAPALGPMVGGWLTDNISWHWVFLINVPIGLIAFAMVSIFVTEPPLLIKERKALIKKGLSVDYIGFALVAVGFGVLQVVLDEFQEDDGFRSSFIIGATIIAGVALVTLVVWEWNHKQPVMDVRLLRFPSFSISCVMMFLVGFVLLASTQITPQLTQSLFGYNATISGLSLGYGGFAAIIVLPLAGFLTGKLPPKYLLVFGFGLIGSTLMLETYIDLAASFRTIVFYRVLQMMGIPFIFIPISAVSFNGIPVNKTSEASALINLMRNLGSSFGISFVQTLLAWREQFHYERLGELATPYRTGLMSGGQKALGQVVATQAALLSYLDLFYALGVATLIVCPLALFIKNKPKPKPKEA
jgi:DHA2 family multidrug resistance protein